MESRLFYVAASSIVAFIATNLDDLFLLMIFFSQTNKEFRRRHIILGQYIGFSSLVLFSLLGIFGTFLIPKTWIGLLGFVPILIAIKKIIDAKKGQPKPKVEILKADIKEPNILLGSFVSPYTYTVAAITIANGSDNISIYVPLLAHSNLVEIVVTITIFYLLVAVWCFAAYKFANRGIISVLLSKHKDIIEIVILFGLGFWIFIDNNVLSILSSFR